MACCTHEKHVDKRCIKFPSDTAAFRPLICPVCMILAFLICLIVRVSHWTRHDGVGEVMDDNNGTMPHGTMKIIGSALRGFGLPI